MRRLPETCSPKRYGGFIPLSDPRRRGKNEEGAAGQPAGAMVKPGTGRVSGPSW